MDDSTCTSYYYIIYCIFKLELIPYHWQKLKLQVCGNTILWKGAETTPLVSIATTKIVADVLQKNNIPGAVATLCCGGVEIGKAMAADTRIKLLSFTGSTTVGQQVMYLILQYVTASI